MIDMDYEKKYNDALERAKMILCNISEGERCSDIETIFPELRESEDERIRKWLYDYISNCPNNNFAFYGGVGKDAVLNYLEKQKEHQNNSDAPKEKSVGGNFYSSHKDKNLDEIAQDYVDNVKEYNPEPTWDLMQTAVCYGYHYREQKEQKPNVEICPHSIKSKSYKENGYPIEDCVQKPAEWNEEDEKMFEKINGSLNGLKTYINEHPSMSQAYKESVTKGIERQQDWLKSLRPVSKESLQSHWKPSEEQMEALKCAVEDVAKFSKRGGRQVELENEPYYSALHSLYCNLEKLM